MWGMQWALPGDEDGMPSQGFEGWVGVFQAEGTEPVGAGSSMQQDGCRPAPLGGSVPGAGTVSGTQ